VVDGLRSEDRFYKGGAAGQRDILSIPSWKFPGTFIFKELKVPTPKAPHRERKAKVSQREGGTGCRNTLEDRIKVNILASNRNDVALSKVGTKTGNISKALKDHRKILDVLFDRRHKDGRIVRIKRGPQNVAAPPKLMKKPMGCGTLKDLR
jgi:hypothetical protein